MQLKSQEIYMQAKEFMPGGVNSPIRSFSSLSREPIIVKRGEKSRIFDVDGREYIDYCMSWGALILGHAHPVIVDAVQKALLDGTSYGLCHPLEVEMAKKVLKHFPSHEKIRFFSSGTEATMTAIRLARGYTGRSKIIKFKGHYHGHSDALLVKAGSGVFRLNSEATSKGIPATVLQDTIVLSTESREELVSFFKSERAKECAAVILEPVTGNQGVVLPPSWLLSNLREETKKVGALLIFDEVITGFRASLRGVQGVYGIEPDLTALGKVIGGGFPIAALAGRREILDFLAPIGEVYQAGTLSGNPIAMRAGFETLSLIEKEGFYEEMEAKMIPFVEAIEEVCPVSWIGSMFSLQLEDKEFSRLFSHLLERGILAPPGSNEAWFLSSAHTKEELQFTAQAIRSFF